jgi:hypothetical protein
VKCDGIDRDDEDIISGFYEESHEPWVAEVRKPCFSPQHNPPNMLYVPQGQRYIHRCPSCGAVSVIEGSVMRA